MIIIFICAYSSNYSFFALLVLILVLGAKLFDYLYKQYNIFDSVVAKKMQHINEIVKNLSNIDELTTQTKSLISSKFRGNIGDITIDHMLRICQNQELFCILASHCKKFLYEGQDGDYLGMLEALIYDTFTDARFYFSDTALERNKLEILADIIPPKYRMIRICGRNELGLVLSHAVFSEFSCQAKSYEVLECKNGMWYPTNPQPIGTDDLPCFGFSEKIISTINEIGLNSNITCSSDDESIDHFKIWMKDGTRQYSHIDSIRDSYTRHAIRHYIEHKKVIALSRETIEKVLLTHFQVKIEKTTRNNTICTEKIIFPPKTYTHKPIRKCVNDASEVPPSWD